METTRRNAIWRIIASGLVICTLILALPSCSEDEDWLNNEVTNKALIVERDLYYGLETFTIQSAKTSINETRTSLNSDFDFFDGNFTLKVQNGISNKTKVSEVEIKIDGNVIVNSADFKKKVSYVEKPISLTPESALEVYIKGPKGSYIELLIEGTLIIGEVIDVDGNTYGTVKIGNQWWMADNLKVTRYTDFEAIPHVTSGTEWIALNSPAYCWFNNDELNKINFGALYNWHTVNTEKLCPNGWHVPTDYEWIILSDYLGGTSVAGGKLKATGTLEGGNGLWLSPNTGATNESGFSGVPGGYRIYNGIFQWAGGIRGEWWSATKDYGGYAYARGLLYNSEVLDVGGWQSLGTGFSIRCVKNTLEGDYDGDSYSVAEGDCDDTNPSINPGATEICGDGIDQNCDGNFVCEEDVDNDSDGYNENQGDCDDTDATIYPGALEICGDGVDQDCNGHDLNCEGPVYGEPIVDTDGNIYKTVLIGNQWWMAENLKATKYSNGDNIYYVANEAVWLDEWGNTDNPYGFLVGPGAYCYYNYDVNNAPTYGLLYNWIAVNDNRKICPTGWHVPSENEWVILRDYFTYNGGGALKATGTVEAGDGLWNAPNLGATNETGFTALPAGYHDPFVASGMSNYSYFWTATGITLSPMSAQYAVFSVLQNTDGILGVGGTKLKISCMSVRCIKDY